MASFKMLKGPETGLSKIALTEGQGYLTTDTNKLFFDIKIEGLVQRIQINSKYAKGLRGSSGTLEISDIALKSEITSLNTSITNLSSDMTTAKSNITTLQSDMTTAKSNITNLQSGLNTANTNINKATSNSYSITITPANWATSGSKFTYTYSNTAIRCGKTGSVPPIITYTSNQKEYSYIESAVATAGTGIVFTATTKPTSNIGLIIVDPG